MRRTLRLPPTCGARSESWIAVVHGPPFPDITDVMQHAKCITYEGNTHDVSNLSYNIEKKITNMV